MDGMPLRFLLRSLFCAGILGAVACGQVNSAKTNIAGPNLIGNGGGSSSPGAPSGGGGGTVVDSAGFFLAATGSSNTAMVKYMHQADAAFGTDIGTTNFSSACKIADGSADGGNLTCVAEVEELDLWFNNLNIQYHVPGNMCTYLSVRPYWFYAYAPGTGPSVASHEVAFDGTITDRINTIKGVPSCPYDYTKTGGPNCCVGGFNHTITTYASNGTVSSTQTIPKNWGGSIGNCVAGAAASLGDATTSLANFTPKSIFGTPLPVVFYVAGTGLNYILQVKGGGNASYNGRSPLASNLWSANFYNPSDHVASGGTPYPYQYPAGFPGGPTYLTPGSTYLFTCMDAAQEIRQQIRLLVREWNTHDQMVQGGNPNVVGTEPGYPGQPLNDVSDWADFGANYPASSL